MWFMLVKIIHAKNNDFSLFYYNYTLQFFFQMNLLTNLDNGLVWFLFTVVNANERHSRKNIGRDFERTVFSGLNFFLIICDVLSEF